MALVHTSFHANPFESSRLSQRELLERIFIQHGAEDEHVHHMEYEESSSDSGSDYEMEEYHEGMISVFLLDKWESLWIGRYIEMCKQLASEADIRLRSFSSRSISALDCFSFYFHWGISLFVWKAFCASSVWYCDSQRSKGSLKKNFVPMGKRKFLAKFAYQFISF